MVAAAAARDTASKAATSLVHSRYVHLLIFRHPPSREVLEDALLPTPADSMRHYATSSLRTLARITEIVSER